ncbi:MAG: hypothetical protein MJ071_05095 [Oscillospiraceae bacterium]|nr:hypothetical protein [Oscillospiraceae bacterium]
MYPYNSVKLEKGMHHLSNCSFTQALENADPSSAYAGTPLANLDAYERQLKRFNIRISGADCDHVEKFYATTESAVLFPEFVRRAVRSGMEDSILSELTATVSSASASACKGFAIDETDGVYSGEINEGALLKKTAILESAAIDLPKYGRLVTASYEAIRQQRLDALAVILRAVGRKIAAGIAKAALGVIRNSVTPFSSASSAVTYGDLATLYGKFSDYDLTTVIASPSVVAEILAMNQMHDRTLDQHGQIRLPFGAKLLKDASLDNKTIIGISKPFALAAISGSDVLLESDRLIDCQLDRIAVSVRMGFQPMMSGAAAVLSLRSA